MKPAEKILLHDHHKRLRMPIMRKVYGECAWQAEGSGARYDTYLLQLTSQETEPREHYCSIDEIMPNGGHIQHDWVCKFLVIGIQGTL